MAEDKPPVFSGVYLDTNVLRQLPARGPGVDFVELSTIAEKLGVELHAPELALRELVAGRVEDIAANLEQAKKQIEHADSWLPLEMIAVPALPAGRELAEAVDAVTSDYLHDLGIGVVPTPLDRLALKSLIAKAVNHEPPFQSKDRGFKDAVILSTVADHMRGKGHQDALFVTHDKIFRDERIRHDLESEGLNLVIVDDLAEAKNLLQKRLGHEIATFLVEGSQKLLGFLRQHGNEVYRHLMANASVSKFFLSRAKLKETGVEIGKEQRRIRRVTSVRPVEIVRALPFGISKDKGEEHVSPGIQPVTFAVRTEFDVVIEAAPGWQSLFSQPTFPLAEPTAYEKIRETYVDVPPKEEAVTLVLDISVQGEIQLDEEGNCSSLRLGRVLAY